MKIIEFLGTCASQSIGSLAEKTGRKSSYKNACKAINEYSPQLSTELALNLHNPWSEHTNIKNGSLMGCEFKNFKILHIVHSAVDYLFLIKQP